MIKWIFFDVGGVLGDESRFTKWRLSNDLRIIQMYKPDFREADLIAILPEASAMIGSLDTNIIQIALTDSPNQETALGNLKKNKEIMPDYYDWLEIRHEAKNVLKLLSGKYKLGIMANQHSKGKVKLQEAGILDYFEHTKVSGDYHVEKPNPEFFRSIFESTGAKPEESVLIDDNIERGLLPAKLFGMTTIWYQSMEREGIPSNTYDYKIDSLKDLLKIL